MLEQKEACKAAGVKQIDYMVVTHYDADHVGGVPALAAGKAITEPLKGAGQPNPACDTTPRKVWGPNARGIIDNQDTNENAMAINLLPTRR